MGLVIYINKRDEKKFPEMKSSLISLLFLVCFLALVESAPRNIRNIVSIRNGKNKDRDTEETITEDKGTEETSTEDKGTEETITEDKDTEAVEQEKESG